MFKPLFIASGVRVEEKMSRVRPDKLDDILCACSGTTEQQLRHLISEGVNDPERLSRITGACSGCGSCEPALMALVNDSN